MKLTRLLTLTVGMMLLSESTSAQVLTLKECLQRGLERNIQMLTSKLERQKARYATSENRALLLPQISAYMNFSDNPEPPVSVTKPNGMQYNKVEMLPVSTTGGIQLSMPIYNQTLWTSQQLMHLLEGLSDLTYEKAQNDLIMQVARMYYLAQVTKEQISILEDNISRMEGLRNITQTFYDNDMALEVDLKRVDINLEALKSQTENAHNMFLQQLNMLKYVIDIPMEIAIDVVPLNPDELPRAETTGVDPTIVELQVLDKQMEITQKQRKIVSNGYLPTLYLSGNYTLQSWGDNIGHIFSKLPYSRWYNSYGLGLSLRVPIFDGQEKRFKLKKSAADIETLKLQSENTRKYLNTQYVNTVNDLENSLRNYNRQRDNYHLAAKVYEITTDQYREGVACMTDVLQDEMRMSSAQSEYITSSANYRIAQLNLLHLTNQLQTLLK